MVDLRFVIVFFLLLLLSGFLQSPQTWVMLNESCLKDCLFHGGTEDEISF